MTGDSKHRLFEPALRAVAVLQNAGYEAYIVGGAVRDRVLGKEPHDVDVATSAQPEDVQRAFARTVDIGAKHGTILALVPEPVEVTTFRTERGYTDRRRPDEVAFVKSLEEDLKRRDFTMNALALDKNGAIVDLFGGIEDIQRGAIRAVGAPEQRFREDALRMLRAARFAAQLGFAIEPRTRAAMQVQSRHLLAVSKERIKAEIDRIWTAAHPQRGVSALVETGLAALLAGGWERLRQTGDRLKPFERAHAGWALLSLAGEASSVRAFYPFSNAEKRAIDTLLQLAVSWRAGGFSDREVLAYRADLLQEATACCAVLGEGEEIPLAQLEARKRALPLASEGDLAVSGSDLLAWSGKPAGAWIKEELESILLAVLDGRLANEKNAIRQWWRRA